MPPRTIVAADDVGAVDGVPIALHGKPAEMHDAFDAGDHGLYLRGIAEIGGDKVVAGREIRRRTDVA